MLLDESGTVVPLLFFKLWQEKRIYSEEGLARVPAREPGPAFLCIYAF